MNQIHDIIPVMLKPPLNPKAIDLLKSCDNRSISLDRIKPIIIDGKKLCAWCNLEKVHGPKYCGKECALSARAHFYIQKEESLWFLLVRQDFKCAGCQHDYKPLILQLLVNGRVYDKPNDYITVYSYWLMKRIKQKSPKEFRPEIDHKNAIYKGNSPFSINLEGVSCLCYTCHKAKTKQDLSGPRKKKI